MPDRADARARFADVIAADYATLAREIIRACPAPAGHRWDVPRPSELTWFQGDVIDSTRHGASLFLIGATPDVPDDERYHVEVRWFPKNPDRSDRAHRARHEAILWCTRGPRRGGFRNLLDAPEIFPKADRIEDLASVAAGTLRRILWP